MNRRLACNLDYMHQPLPVVSIINIQVLRQ